MKYLAVIAIVLGSISCSQQKNRENLSKSEFDAIYPLALRGDLQQVFVILDTLKVKNLSPTEIAIKQSFYDRFVVDREDFDYNSTDSVIILFVDLFHSYWKHNLMDPKQPISDAQFSNSIQNFLIDNNYKSRNLEQSANMDSLYEYTNDFLNDKGYYSNAMGKTGHLYDLFLWKSESINNYTVNLIDTQVNVSVHLLEDFIVKGWSHFATFGKSYASGWATRNALYCISDAYDLSSENYKISYLTHEGQHFADYKTFPQLEQKDLEYRAKLVEITKSNTTTLKIIEKFITNANNQPNNAHGFANYCVVRDLSMQIFSLPFVDDIDKWVGVDPKIIKEKSLQLFHTNTKNLHGAGNETVRSILK